MHSNRTHAIFWAPPATSFSASYESLIQGYLQNVAADSGKYTNVYGSDRQYYDSSGLASYGSTTTGYQVDTNALPASGCSASLNPCITDAQLETELQSYITAHALPTGLGEIYFVFTPSGIDSCTDGSSSQCSTNTYCAYHSSFAASGGGSILYSNLPYPPTNGCSARQHPNPSDPAADTIINSLSHEHNETITDPLGDAWFDPSGNENGDNCNGSFAPQVGTVPAQYNQTIAGAHYDLQGEWSNADRSCVQTFDRPTFAMTPRLARPNQPIAFDGRSSDNGGGVITSYSWAFGDGTFATGPTPTHSYPGGAGSYAATLTVTRSDGSASITATRSVELNQPSCSQATASTAGLSVAVSLACANPLGGDSVAFRSILAAPAHGTLDAIDQAAGTVVYRPNPGYSGPDAFSFAATDSGGFRGSATAQINVEPSPHQVPSPIPATIAPPPLPTTAVNGDSVTAARPALDALRLTRNVFNRRLRAQALISYTVTQAGLTSFSLERRVNGVRRAGRCVPGLRGPRSRKRCRTFARQLRGYAHRDSPGWNRIALRQVIGRDRLLPGSYRLVASYRASDASTSRATITFVVR